MLYIGETARSVGEGVNEHLIKYETKDKNPVFHTQVEENTKVKDRAYY